MMGLFARPAARAVNHVLRSAPVAMERLRKHAGRTAVFELGPVTLGFTVQTTGQVSAALPGAARDLEVRISPFLLPRIVANEEAAFREIEMKGDMEFAQEVSYLAANVTWDFEEDLSRVVGDIAAHRIVSVARQIGRWGRDAPLRLAQGAAEYWTEESPLIATRVKIDSFVGGVAELRDAVERLAKRVEKLS
jgi:ubiquinone biosynthesis protein UbiJ